MYSFSKYKEQYIANLRLAIPVVLSQLGQVFVQLADNIMVGRYGGDNPDPLAATSFGGSVFFLVYISTMGLCFGITPIIGELFVQGKKDESARYLHNSLVLFSLVAIAVMLFQFAITPLMDYMGQPSDIVELAKPYYHTLVWSMLPATIFMVFKQFMEGVGNTKTTMYIVIFCNMINIALNYVLINGHYGMPEMGALGAGLSTLISRILQMALIASFFFSLKEFCGYIRCFTLKSVSKLRALKLVNVGLPISSQIFFECSAFVITGILMGLFGKSMIGANQIGHSLMNCAFMIILAISSATTIRVSHCYGARDFAQMKLASTAARHLAIVWNTTTALCFVLLRGILPQIFTTNAEMIEMCSVLLIYIAMFQISDGLQCIAVGIMRGMQDVKPILPIGFFSYWVLNIPVGYLCAFTLGIGPKGLYIGYIVGLTMAAILMYRRIAKRQKELLCEA